MLFKSSIAISANLPISILPSVLLFPIASAPPNVAISKTVFAFIIVGLWSRGLWISAAFLISLNISKLLLHGAPSAPKETQAPISNNSGILANPEANLRFELIQWTILVFVLTSISISSSSRWIQWAKTSFSPVNPNLSKYTIFLIPRSFSTSEISPKFSDAWVWTIKLYFCESSFTPKSNSSVQDTTNRGAKAYSILPFAVLWYFLIKYSASFKDSL